MMPWLMKRLEDTEAKLSETEDELENKERALGELRQAYAALPSPEEFDQKLKAELDRVTQRQEERLTSQKEAHAAMLARQQREQDKVIAQQRQESEQWKEALAVRQQEIQAAKVASKKLSQKAEDERRTRKELDRQLKALESRGLIARLLNRKPKSVTG